MWRGGWKPGKQTNRILWNTARKDMGKKHIEIKQYRIFPSAQLMFLQVHWARTFLYSCSNILDDRLCIQLYKKVRLIVLGNDIIRQLKQKIRLVKRKAGRPSLNNSNARRNVRVYLPDQVDAIYKGTFSSFNKNMYCALEAHSMFYLTPFNTVSPKISWLLP